MLYISRFIGSQRYGVVDTEDGIETSVTKYDLEEYVMGLGIHIEGVETDVRTRHGRRERYISKIQVHQNEDYISREQAKLGMLRGIDIKVYDGQIVSVTWEPDRIDFNQRLRLSDYGTSCGDSILRDAPLMSTSHPLVLVLDDKISISRNTFTAAYVHGVAVDVREIKQFSTADAVYTCYMKKPNILGSLDSMIFDNGQRQDYYRGVIVLNVGLGAIVKLSDVVGNCQEVTDKIARKYKRQFESVSRAKYLAVANDRWVNVAKQYYSWVQAPQYRYFLDDSEVVLENKLYFVKIFEAMMELSTVDKTVLTRFENFMLNFEQRQDIDEIFVRFVSRASKWVMEYGKAHHW